MKRANIKKFNSIKYMSKGSLVRSNKLKNSDSWDIGPGASKWETSTNSDIDTYIEIKENGEEDGYYFELIFEIGKYKYVGRIKSNKNLNCIDMSDCDEDLRVLHFERRKRGINDPVEEYNTGRDITIDTFKRNLELFHAAIYDQYIKEVK